MVNTTGGTIADALEEAFWDDFEEECGVKVERFDMTSRTFAQLTQFAEADSAPFDLGNTYSPEEFTLGVQAGIFHELSDDFWDAYEGQMVEGSYSDYGAWGYAVVYLMLTNTDEFPDGLSSWADFFNADDYPGPRGIQDVARTSVVMALLGSGYTPDTLYPMSWDKVDEAFATLEELKPAIRTFTTQSDQPVQGVGSGDFVAAWASTGRGLGGIADGLPIEINWTAGGDSLSYDWYILKNAEHPLAAEALLHYMQDAERQAEFFELFGYSAGNKDIVNYLDDDQAAQVEQIMTMFTATSEQSQWWVDNAEELQERWDAWKATGGFGG
ncbi:MAG: extracellular solute-binding protein [Microbacterium sp.]